MPSKHSSALSLGPVGKRVSSISCSLGLHTWACPPPPPPRPRQHGASVRPAVCPPRDGSAPRKRPPIAWDWGTCALAQAALLGALAEGRGALQGATLVVVLEDGRGELFQAAAQQVRSLLGPLVAGKLPAPSYEVEKRI